MVSGTALGATGAVAGGGSAGAAGGVVGGGAEPPHADVNVRTAKGRLENVNEVGARMSRGS